MNVVYLDEIGHSYSSHWSLTDFYPETEAKLKELISSQEDFECDWFGCKKEIRYAKYRREGKQFTVEVSVHCDDLWGEVDLIEDAVWENDIKIDELEREDVENIRDIAIDEGLDDCVKLESIIDSSATFEDVVAETEKLEEEATRQAHAMFEKLCLIVKEYFEHKEGLDSMEELYTRVRAQSVEEAV